MATSVKNIKLFSGLSYNLLLTVHVLKPVSFIDWQSGSMWNQWRNWGINKKGLKKKDSYAPIFKQMIVNATVLSFGISI